MCNATQCRYLAQASHLVVTCEAGGRLRAVEAAGAAALGYSPSDLSGRSLFDLAAAQERPHLERILQRCQADQTVWDELTVRTASGRTVQMRCCFQRLVGPDPRGGVLVTGLRLDALEVARQAHLAAVLGRVAFRCHGPAHRLMTALEAALAQDPSSETVRRCRAELDTLLEVLTQSLSGSPACRGGAPPQGQAVDVVAVLEAALRLADGDDEFRGLAVALRPERAAVWAATHPVGLVFLALHLVRNARDATGAVKSPRLLIDVYRDGNQVILAFADNGSGLPREDLGCAFSPCFKKKAGDTKHTGLGLATCSEVVQCMGGTIRMQSRPSKGTTVLVTLPAAEGPTA
ncbi:MAG: PAS domain-containing sensor histidine kinase [Planctomycetes bacterium]|nr:PAS domain-containing sensor histidine kinase [Planctomycetota bacterium]